MIADLETLEEEEGLNSKPNPISSSNSELSEAPDRERVSGDHKEPVPPQQPHPVAQAKEDINSKIDQFFHDLPVFHGYNPSQVPRNWWEFSDCEYGSTCRHRKDHNLIEGLRSLPGGGYAYLPVKTTFCTACGKTLTGLQGYGVSRPPINQDYHPDRAGRHCGHHEKASSSRPDDGREGDTGFTEKEWAQFCAEGRDDVGTQAAAIKMRGMGWW